MQYLKNQEVAIKASKLIKFDEQGNAIVSEKVLDDVIRNAQKVTTQKNFVPGSEVYSHGYPALQGFLGAARQITQTLINSGEMPIDKYMLLSCKTKSFDKQNVLANTILKDLRDQDQMEAVRKRKEDPESVEAKQPFTEDQLANISSTPDLNNPESHVVDETTKDGGRFRFDKINFEITVFKTDGTTVVIALAPQGSWRFTILNWIRKMVNSISSGLTSIRTSITGGFKRLFSRKPVEVAPPEPTDLKVVNGEIVEATSETTTTLSVKEETPVEVVVATDAKPKPVAAEEPPKEKLSDKSE